MADKKDKWVEAVAKLIKLTQENKITWTSQSPPEILRGSGDDYVETVFLTTFNKRRLRLYKNDYKVEHNDALSAFGLSVTGSSAKFTWYSRVILEMLDSFDNKIWTFPEVTPLQDLYTSVCYQAADVNGFIEDLLNLGKYELYKSGDGEFRFQLKLANGEKLLVSDGYRSKAGAENAIQSFKKNATDNNRYEKRESSGGKYYFVLKARNGEVIGTSQMYETNSERDNGIESVKIIASDVAVEDLT